MPAGFYIDGQITYRPVVSVVSQFAGQTGAGGVTKTLAVVGEFPFLQANVPYFYTAEAALLAAAPGNAFLRELARVIFHPGSVGGRRQSPRVVLMLNATPNSQAQAGITDPLGGDTLRIVSDVWGPSGNLITVNVAPRVGFGGYDVRVTSNGASESFVTEEQNGVLQMAYLHPNNGDTMVAPMTARGFDNTIDGTGTLTAGKAVGQPNVTVTFSRTISDDCAGPNNTHLSWVPDGPVTGALTITVPGGDVLAVGPLRVKVTGYSAMGGLTTEVTGPTVFTKALVEGVGPTAFTTATTWSSISNVSVYSDAGAGDWVGDITFSGTNMLLGPASGQDTVLDVINYLNGLRGFSGDTESSRPSKIPTAQLDPVMADVFPAEFDANRWAFYTGFNENASYAAVEYVGDYALAPNLSTEISFPLAGGTQGTAVLGNWEAAFAVLRIHQCTVVVPVSTDVDVATAARDHAVYMWGKGQSECQVVLAAPGNSTLSALKLRRRQLNDFRATLLCDTVRVRMPDGSITAPSATYWAVMFGALQCSTADAGQPLGGALPYVVSFSRHASIQSVEGAEELLRSSITPLLDDGTGVKVARWVTTYSEDNDLTRTEGSAVESLALSNIGVRRAVTGYLNQRAISGLAPAIQGDIAAELGRQVDNTLIRTWEPSSLKVQETATAFVGRYNVAPILPVLNIAITSVAFSFPRA